MSTEYFNEVTHRLKLNLSQFKVGSKEARVLIVYSGGTIGMIQSNEGYVPALDKFTAALKKNYSFHDKVEHAQRLLKGNYSNDNFITPESFFGKRIIYKLIEMNPLLDSSNMQMHNVLEIAKLVEQHYYDYDGFLILHGTDTMAYTASALSFIFENLQKPVILTGAQIPYFEVRNDAAENLLEALTIAGHFNIPEVCLHFNNKLYRGNRTTKVDNSSFESFESPNCSYLIKCGIGYKVKWDIIRHSYHSGRFSIQKELSSNISVLHFFPIISLEVVKSAVQEPTKAVIILSYGAGNVPSNRADIIEVLKSAVDRGVVILNITQCKKGGTSANYQSGKILADIGVIFGSDMTLESAVTKLSYLLGKYPNDLASIKQLLTENIRGELTTEQEKISFSYTTNDLLSSIGNSLGLYTQNEKLQAFNKYLTLLTHSAAYDGLIDDLKRMHNENISMELKDHEGRTLLHVACRIGSIELVQFLLEDAKVNVNEVDISGHTPLYLAIMRDFIAICELLVAKGGEIRSKPNVIAQALCEAVIVADLVKIKLFIQAGVNLQVCDFQGRNLAHAAVVCGQVDAIRFLKENCKFDWDCKDTFGDTPRNMAEKLGNREILDII